MHRPIGDGSSSDPLFGAYISVLPRDFASHPVTWIVNQDLRQHDSGTELLDHLPPTTLAALKKVCLKFWEDWDAVCKFMVTFRVNVSSFISHVTPVANSRNCRQAHTDPASVYTWEPISLHGLSVGVAEWFERLHLSVLLSS